MVNGPATQPSSTTPVAPGTPGVPSAREAIEVAARPQRIGRGLARALSQGRLGEACRQDQSRAESCVQGWILCAAKSMLADAAAHERRRPRRPAEPQRAPPMFRLPFRRALPRPLRYPPPSRPFRRKTPISSPSSTISNGTMIPMRDGVRLFTIVYEPRDTTRIYPILLVRTPYSIRPYEPDEYRRVLGPSQEFDKDGYIFVFQDARGKFRSEGEFEVMRPFKPSKRTPKDGGQSSDTHDTIEWLLKSVPRNNGRVGMWGISYPGWQTVMGMNAHPALKAASPQVSVGHVHRRRLPPQRRVPSDVRVQLAGGQRSHPHRSGHRAETRSTMGRPMGTASSRKRVRRRASTRSTFRVRCLRGTTSCGTRTTTSTGNRRTS